MSISNFRKLLTPIAFALTFALLTANFLVGTGGCSDSKSNGKSSAEGASVQPDVTSFDTPQAATDAIVAAIRNNDQAQLARILGSDEEDVMTSGDDVADKAMRDKFLNAYDEKHSLTTNSDGTVTIVVGNQDWPMPIPIVKDDQTGKWWFDTDAGKDEILNRRIGNNELTVIQVIQAIGDAQTEYAQRDPDGDGVPEYATKFLSDPGKRNGLYWETAEGEPPSPLGELAAEASAQGYSTQRAEGETGPRPYHGYLYRILTAQGPNAPGGATDYMVNGQLIGGYAVVAWPVDYGNSGIMTFIVNHDGVVYQKDLGDDTDKLARAMTTYDPDPSWKKAE